MIGDSICYLIACQYCRQCHVSSGQCLSDAHDVGSTPACSQAKSLPVRPNPVAISSKIRRISCSLQSFFRFTQILRVIKPHTACSLNNGFEDERRQFFGCFSIVSRRG